MLRMNLIFFILLSFITGCDSKNSWSCRGDCENGEGMRVWKDNGIEKRTWINGKLNGQGFQYFGRTSDFAGDTYEGEFKDDLYYGYGIYYDKSEDAKYKGQWKNGKSEGKGIVI